MVTGRSRAAWNQTGMARAPGMLRLARGPLEVEIARTPFAITVRRRGRRIVRGLGVVFHAGEHHDQFVQFTEGVIPGETLADPVTAVSARALDGGELALGLSDGGEARLRVWISGVSSKVT